MSQFGSQQFGGPKTLQGLSGSVGTTPKPVIAPPKPAKDEEDTPIGLINDEDARNAEGKLKAIGVNTSASVRKEKYVRQPFTPGTGACRIRSFHGRLSTQGLEYMDNQINEWLDQHAEVEIKQVTTSVGIFEGKMREPALIVNIWY